MSDVDFESRIKERMPPKSAQFIVPVRQNPDGFFATHDLFDPLKGSAE